ncbi:MAG TPA: hypothetical protein VFR58_17555 [Flavisolibacter sp.]|nr:hypothetical protein [Flavisolibacter sp.]
MVIFSHGTSEGINMEWNQGFYRGGTSYNDPNSANVWDLQSATNTGDIKFEKDATIVLGACNCAKDDNLKSLAYSITNLTGVTTIAATGAVYPELNSGKETGKLKTDGTFIKNEQIVVITMVPILVPGLGVFNMPVPTLEIKQTDLGKIINPASQ